MDFDVFESRVNRHICFIIIIVIVNEKKLADRFFLFFYNFGLFSKTFSFLLTFSCLPITFSHRSFDFDYIFFYSFINNPTMQKLKVFFMSHHNSALYYNLLLSMCRCDAVLPKLFHDDLDSHSSNCYTYFLVNFEIDPGQGL